MADQEGTTAEEVLLYLIAQLVEHPDQVELEIEESDTKLSLMAKVSSEDIGRVIGKTKVIVNTPGNYILTSKLHSIGNRSFKFRKYKISFCLFCPLS